MRKDGWWSYDAPATEEAELLTKPLQLPPGAPASLFVNVLSSVRGSLRCAVLDATTQKPLPGLSLNESIPLMGNFVRQALGWRSGITQLPGGGRNVRLHFVALSAKLYSFEVASLESDTDTMPKSWKTDDLLPPPLSRTWGSSTKLLKADDKAPQVDGNINDSDFDFCENPYFGEVTLLANTTSAEWLASMFESATDTNTVAPAAGLQMMLKTDDRRPHVDVPSTQDGIKTHAFLIKWPSQISASTASTGVFGFTLSVLEELPQQQLANSFETGLVRIHSIYM
jgi:hypothetical protein